MNINQNQNTMWLQAVDIDDPETHTKDDTYLIMREAFNKFLIEAKAPVKPIMDLKGINI